MDNNRASSVSLAHAEASRSHLHKILQLVSDLGGKTSPVAALEEDLFRIREHFRDFKLENLEQSAPDTDFLKAEKPEDITLRYFAQTIQRTQLVGHFVHKGREVPIHYAITGAILLQREGRKFSIWGEPELRNNIILPFAFVENQQVLSSFDGGKNLRVVDSGSERTEYTQLRIAAITKAHEITLEARGRLYLRWRREEGSDMKNHLVASGIVADVPNKWLTDNFVGLSRRVYLPWNNAELLDPQLLIEPHKRGQVLKLSRVSGDDPMQKYTFFIRMRGSSKADPEFGLVRCTFIADNDNNAIDKANRLAARMIDERLPVTFPAPNWDRLIFPLKLCSDYLESLIPTGETVRSYFERQ